MAKLECRVSSLLEKPYGIEQRRYSILFWSMTARHFDQLKQDLERAVSQLKETTDPKLRRDLLLELRRLLAEADRLLVDASTYPEKS
jgi:hypothetical protein